MQPHLHRLLLSKGKAFSILIKVVSVPLNPLTSPRLPIELAPISEPSTHLWLHKDQADI